MTRAIGYKSPPENTRFRKGQSGSPSGRPKGSTSFLGDLTAELNEQIAITEDGKSRKITKRRALVKSLVAHGLKKDVRALQLALQWAAAEQEAAQTGKAGALPPLDAGDLKILQNYLKRQPLPTGDE